MNKITARIVKDRQGYWIIVDGDEDSAFAVTKEELEPIRDAINEWLGNEMLKRVQDKFKAKRDKRNGL